MVNTETDNKYYRIGSAMLDDLMERITSDQMVEFILGQFDAETIDKLCWRLDRLRLEDVSHEGQSSWSRIQIWKGHEEMSPNNYWSGIFDDPMDAYEAMVKQVCEGIGPALILEELTKITEK